MLPSLQPYFQEAPAAWSVALAVVAVAGAVLWLAGGRLARAGVAVGGFLLGGVLATSVAASLEPGAGWVLGIGVGGALAGTLLAFLLYRLWVGLLAGALLAAVVPAALLLWGVDPPATGEGAKPPAAAVDAPSLFGVFDGERGGGGEPGEPVVDEAVREAAEERLGELGAQAEAAFGDFFEAASAAWKSQLDAARAAWDGLSAGARRSSVVGGVGGFVVGLLLGLALPNLTAALQTSLVGACLLTVSVLLLLQRHAGLFRVPAEGASAADGPPAGASGGVDPRVLLLAIGVVTLVGLLLQWTLGRRRADA